LNLKQYLSGICVLALAYWVWVIVLTPKSAPSVAQVAHASSAPTPYVVTKYPAPCALDRTITESGKLWWLCKSGTIYEMAIR
jgi:hypothetical protein